MMKQEDAKAMILAEWRKLPPEERATEHQAATFAMKMKNEYEFRAAGDPYQVIKSWITRYIATGKSN